MRDLLKRSIWPTLFFALVFSALSAQSRVKAQKSKPSASFQVSAAIESQNDSEVIIRVDVASSEFVNFNLRVINLSASTISEPLEEQSIPFENEGATRVFHVKKGSQPIQLIFEAYQMRNGRKIGASARLREGSSTMSLQGVDDSRSGKKEPLPKGTKF